MRRLIQQKPGRNDTCFEDCDFGTCKLNRVYSFFNCNFVFHYSNGPVVHTARQAALCRRNAATVSTVSFVAEKLIGPSAMHNGLLLPIGVVSVERIVSHAVSIIANSITSGNSSLCCIHRTLQLCRHRFSFACIHKLLIAKIRCKLIGNYQKQLKN